MISSLFICSASRSGSTLLDRLIGSHPDALSVGELGHLPKNIALDSTCSCGQHLRQCAFWVPAVDRLCKEFGVDLWKTPYALDLGFVRAGVEIDHQHQTKGYLARRGAYLAWMESLMKLNAGFLRTPLLGRYRDSIENNARVHRVLREMTGKRIVIDSTKGFRWSTGQYLLHPEQTRLVLLSRDGRGVMASYMRSGRSRQKALQHWQKYYESALPWLERHVPPEHVLRVYYERLVSEPAAELERIYRFLGLPQPEGADYLQQHDAHILNGNPMRLGGLQQIKPDDRWQRELNDEDKAYFASAGRTMARSLGYVDDGALPRNP